MANVHVEDWGLIEYTQALARQKAIVQEVILGAPGRLIFCEHPPVITLGRMTKADSLLYSQDDIKAQGVEVIAIDRGGDVTLHAPGQLVVYVIIDLNMYGRDLHAFMQKLEQVAIDLLKDFGILAVSIPGQRGVFLSASKKIVSIGTGVRKWVTYHGLGINVTTDLNLFRLIRPCGLSVAMTSMAKVLNQDVPMDKVKSVFKKHFEKYYN